MFWKRWFARKEEVASPYGPLTATCREVAAETQVRRALEAAELTLKARSIELALARHRELGMTCAVPGQLEPDELDELLEQWNPDVTAVEDFNHVANVLGFAFGEALARNHGMEWAVVGDQFGTDFAVDDRESGATTFPLSVVAKRLESGERAFMGPIAFMIQRESARQQLGA